ncbi:MutS-related protein [Povalibacter sp.]|uniref:MutS-related protein n=1 Tax=Povalibacter sp. TaxID=1962978 RepID=UPI002F3E5001
MNPLDTYRARLQQHEQRTAAFERTQDRLGSLRIVLFLAAMGTAWWLLSRDTHSLWWLSLPVAAFLAAVAWHGRIRRRSILSQRAVTFYRAGIARLEDRWMGAGQQGERFNDPHHVYAADLDLFGHGSLFELLFTGRTRMGEECLARWLLAPAGLQEVRARQEATTELLDRLDLREDIAGLGADVPVGVQPQALIEWAESPNRLTPRWLLPMAFVLPALAIAGAYAWYRWGLISALLLVLIAEGGVIRLFKKELQQAMQSTEQAFEDLKLLAGLIERIEREPVQSARMSELKQQLSSHSVAASAAMSRLATIVQWIESRRNPLMQLLGLPLLYPLHVSLAAERWRNDHGKAVRTWLGAIGEVDTLLSIATYRFEHPHDSLPEFTDGPASVRASQLGHPLLPATRCVLNDVAIVDPTRVLLISGSNMSGKSTLMRTIGINAVLAMAGAPVRAASFELTPLQVGASIRVNDSLHEGSSRFYAEITRLRQLLDLTRQPLPLLFLLDELLQGTNSKDRRIGATGVLRGFLDRGAIGLISTHDLALIDIDTAGSARLRNMHFQDELIDGRMKFDYTLRDGVVTRSNGVELMRSIGLEV